VSNQQRRSPRTHLRNVLSTLGDAGVTVIGAWGDSPAHQIFFVLDADSVEAIQTGFGPIGDQGTADVQPVTDFAGLNARLSRN
jgi:hypothetical protein